MVVTVIRIRFVPSVSCRDSELLLQTHKNAVYVYYGAFMSPNNILCLLIATSTLSCFEWPPAETLQRIHLKT